MWSSQEALALSCLGAVAVAVIARARQCDSLERSRFARMLKEPPPSTRTALARHRWHRLRHDIVPAVVPERQLERQFEAIRAAFMPQQVDYSNTAYGKDHWALSCFMEYSGGVATGKVGHTLAAALLMATASENHPAIGHSPDSAYCSLTVQTAPDRRWIWQRGSQ